MRIKKNKRVLFFIHTLSSGGAERVALRLAQGLRGFGMSTEIISFHHSPEYIDISQYSEYVRIIEGKNLLVKIISLRTHIGRFDPDVVISFTEIPNFINVLLRLFSTKKYKTILTVHSPINIVKHYRQPKLRNIIRQKIFMSMMPFLYSHADAVVTVSKAAAEKLRTYSRIPSKVIRCIYNPIIDSHNMVINHQVNTHVFLDKKAYKTVIGVGRLDQQKNFTLLIKAFALVLEKHPKAKLVIVGEGKEEAMLRTLINNLGIDDSVALVGFVKRPLNYIAKSDLFVLSSDYEGLPTVLVEAMYCGIPVIATDCPTGPREVLSPKSLGALVPVGDTAALAKAISAELSKRTTAADRKKLKTRASTFNFDKSVSSYASLINSLVGGHDRS